jgi:hypothetical protein
MQCRRKQLLVVAWLISGLLLLVGMAGLLLVTVDDRPRGHDSATPWCAPGAERAGCSPP